MKKAGIFIIAMLILLFCLPLLFLKGPDEGKLGDIKSEQGIILKVYNIEKGEIEEMDMEQYITGVVAAEMPVKFNIEALKAQVLAARTYTLMRIKRYGGKGCLDHPEADICTNPAHCQAYKDPTLLGKDMGKLKEAVIATQGQVIIYENQLIDAVFHSTSGGKTENSEDIWTNKIPYLRSVISEYEEGSPKLITQKEISTDDFISSIKKLDQGVKLNKKALAKEIKVIERSEGGRITQIQIGNKTFKGEVVKSALGLNSSNFSIRISNSTILFTVIGYGHGIGMSQYGAEGMAEHGSKYEDIIKHYYQGVEIAKIEELGVIGSN